MRQRTQLAPDMTIDAILRKWPGTVAVLLRHRMLCIGCPVGPFHTVADACREHNVDELAFVVELERTIRATA